jgi:hypothetical protein
MFKDFSNWLHNTATVLFDDTKNDLRALPKTVRLQILIVLSALWSTAFSVWVFTVPMFIYGWLGMFLGHLLIIFVAYYTFKQFQDIRRFRTDPNYHTQHDQDKIFGLTVNKQNYQKMILVVNTNKYF